MHNHQRIVEKKTPLLIASLLAMVTLCVIFQAPLVIADRYTAAYLYENRAPAALEPVVTITSLGDLIMIATIGSALALYFLQNRRGKYALGLTIALIGATVSDFILKNIIGRERPPEVIHAVLENTYSYPSGHATAVAALYGFAIFYLWHTEHLTLRRKVLIALLFCIILAVGFSRLYLGVHYLSDVLGGFLMGALWVAIAARITQKLH